VGEVLIAGRSRNASRPVSRVLSARRALRDDHSSGMRGRPRTSLRPTRAALRKTEPGRSPVPPLFGLAPGGVCRAVPVARAAVRSYRTLSPLLRADPERFAFCGTFPGVAPAGRYPAPCFRGARTFLHRALSGLATAVIRPTGVSTCLIWAFRGDRSSDAHPFSRAGRGGEGRRRRQWFGRLANRRESVTQVERSARPSTRAGRKWRWKAVTVAPVAASKRPDCGTS
jgi:hypothetical protein